jgi:hypothetical protein
MVQWFTDKCQCFLHRAGIFKQSMGARNRVGTRLSYRPGRLHRLAEFIPWNRFLGSINVKNTGSVCLGLSDNESFIVHKNYSILIRQHCRMTVSHFQVVLKIIFYFSFILCVIFLNSGNGIFSADRHSELSVLTSSVEPRCCE